MKEQSFELDWAGRKLTVETGKLAKQANGAVTVRYGDTTVLATVVLSGYGRGMDFFPLMVEYEEKLYAAGKIKGSRFVKREGRASDDAQLTARLIDRPLRPMFDQRIRKDIQVVLTVMSYDGENDADIPAMIGAATAVLISDIPFEAPVAGVRVGVADGEFVITPTVEQRKDSPLDLVLAGTTENIVMVEAGAKEVPEEDVLKAMEYGHEHIKQVCKFQQQIIDAIGKEKMEMDLPEEGSDELKSKIKEVAGSEITELLTINNKLERNAATEKLQGEVVEKIMAEFDDKFSEDKLSVISEKEKEKNDYEAQVKESFHDAIANQVREDILQKETRIGGRGLADIRPISVETGLLPRTHGSGLFTRGETQVMTLTTLGSPGDEQIVDGLEEEFKKRFMHHYNMPAFATGETKPSRWPSRRELGHGALAERALTPMLPDQESFPYTIRLVSEVLEANGSTSMASTCASSLALMDAGVPIKSAVAGVAMGLITDGKDNYKVLTDIQGEEDHIGDMDFKVTGTRTGVTCMQMDIKVKGIPKEVFEKALHQAQAGRLEILDKMDAVIKEPKAEMSKYAPRIETIRIKQDQIGDVIGPGGKIINKIIDETGVKIDIDDEGIVQISSTDPEGMKDAVQQVKDITREAKVGELYHGKVTRLMDFGAFVEIFPGTEGLVHISQLAPFRVNKVEDIVKEGDEVDVIVSEIDDQNRVNLSKKMADEKLGNKQPIPPNSSGDSRGPKRGPHKKPFFKGKR